MSNASSYITNNGGFITQTRYDGSVATYNAATYHTLNSLTKYVVCDIVGGGGGGHGGFRLGGSAQYHFGGTGGGGGGSMTGLVYYIRPQDNGRLSFVAGKGGLGSSRNQPAGVGQTSSLSSMCSVSGGGAMAVTQSTFTTWFNESGQEAWVGAGYLYYSAFVSAGGKVHVPQEPTSSAREPSHWDVMSIGGRGGAGSVYTNPARAGTVATNSATAGGIAVLYHRYTDDANGDDYNDVPGGGGGSSYRGVGGHGNYIGANAPYIPGRYGSGGGGGSLIGSGGDNPTAASSLGGNGGAGYVWIREFG